MRTLIQGGWVVGFEGRGHELIANGCVVFEGDRVIHVGRQFDGNIDRRIEARGKLISPGFINCHLHAAELSCAGLKRLRPRDPHHRKESNVIYEIRTYRIAPRSLAEVEKRFGEAYEYRKKYSELTAFWHTEIGPLNEIVHVWGYRDLAERARIRGEAMKDSNWPPKIGEFVRAMRSEIVVPFSFVPEVRPGKVGPIFELRYYTLKPGTLPEVAKGWEAKLPERMKLSPVVLAGGVEFGKANGFVHVWAYSSLDQRAQVRAEAVKKGVWPPPGGADQLLTQDNKILLPSAFSPLQ